MRSGLILFFILMCNVSTAKAQCIAEVTNIIQDTERGSIIVETKYTLNGVVVQATGRSRYLETTGTLAEIITKAKEDIKIHCDNLVKRIGTNTAFLNAEITKQQKALTNKLITDMQSLKGFKLTLAEVVYQFKGKDIKVTHDSQNTVTNTP